MRYLYLKLFVVSVTIFILSGCRQDPPVLSRIETGQVQIDSSLTPDDSLTAFIQPYHDHVNEVLDAPLSYAPALLSKKDGQLNSSLGNLLADIVLQQADGVYQKQKGRRVDLAVLNYGGIRSVISAGPVSERTSYEVMPFENKIHVIALQGKAIRDMAGFLIAAGVAHPIAGMQIVQNPDGSLHSINIGGKPFDEERIYYVATSDYLVGGGDEMGFFREGTDAHDTGYKIRNALTDYFQKTDTLHASVDDRFIKLPAR